MESTEAIVSSEASPVANGASRGTNHGHSSINANATTTTAVTRDIATDDTAGVSYGEILDDLYRRIEGASYYSGSSATWFLRGALAKYEEDDTLCSGKGAFLPRGLTDVLLDRLLLRAEGDDPSTQHKKKDDEDKESHTGIFDKPIDDSDADHKNYLIVAKALACDHSKYLPAIAESLSDFLSSTSSTDSSARFTTNGRTKIAIPKEFLQLWVSAIVDHSTPDTIHDQLSDDLFVAFQRQLKLSDSKDPSTLPAHALRCAVDGDSWNNNIRGKALSPPETEATLRRASFLLRFLSRDSDCKALHSEAKLNISESSGAIEWFLKTLESEGCPRRHLNQQRETRLGLLGLLVDECKVATDVQSASVEWFFSPKLEKPILLFFKMAIRDLVEDWNEHLATPIQATTSNQPGSANTSSSFQNRINCDLLPNKNREALFCATLYVRSVARLPKAYPRLSIAAATEASIDCDHGGRELMARMLREEGSSLQRLRLVRLLIDEFGSLKASEANPNTDNPTNNTSQEEWLSSPEIMAPVLEECSNDPFLGSSDATIRYLGIYGDPSWKESFLQKPMPRDAPVPKAFRSSPASGFAQTPSAHTNAPSPRLLSPGWLSESVGRLWQIPVPRAAAGRGGFLQVVRNTVVDRLGRKSQDDQLGLFDGSHQTNNTGSRQHDHYSLFPGG